MEITGFDTVLMAPGPAAPGIARFLDRWRERWPGLLVGVDGITADACVPWTPGELTLPPESGEVSVVRDEQMDDFWEAEGYALDRHGEGPFLLLYRPCPRQGVRATVLDDPYDHGTGFRPYETVLASGGMSLVTVVTPDDDSPFSRDVVSTLLQHL